MLSKRRTHLEKQTLSQDENQEIQYRNIKRTRILNAIEVPTSDHDSYGQSMRSQSVASIRSEEQSVFEPPEALAEPMSLQPATPQFREESGMSDMDSVFSLGASAGDIGDASFALNGSSRGARRQAKRVEWEPMDDAIRLQIDKVLKEAMDTVLEEDFMNESSTKMNKIETRGHLHKYIKATRKRIARTVIPSNAKASLFDPSNTRNQASQLEQKVALMVDETITIGDREATEKDALEKEIQEVIRLREEYRKKLAQERETKKQMETLHALISMPPARDDYVIALTQNPSSKFSANTSK